MLRGTPLSHWSRMKIFCSRQSATVISRHWRAFHKFHIDWIGFSHLHDWNFNFKLVWWVQWFFFLSLCFFPIVFCIFVTLTRPIHMKPRNLSSVDFHFVDFIFHHKDFFSIVWFIGEFKRQTDFCSSFFALSLVPLKY